MVRDGASSGLTAIDRVLSENFTSVQVSAEIVLWPCHCACCGALLPPPPGAKRTKTGLQAVRMSVETFAPFLCPTCTNHVALHAEGTEAAPAPQGGNSAPGLWGCGGPLLFIALAAPGCALMNPLLAVFLAVVLTAAILAVVDDKLSTRAAARQAAAALAGEQARDEAGLATMGPDCVHFKSPVTHEHPGGYLHTFRFRNPKIAGLFAELNEEKIVY